MRRSFPTLERLWCVLAAAGFLSLFGSPKAYAIPVQSAATGNHYEYIVAAGIDWLDARLAAEEILFSFGGTSYTGYLATITSAEEYAFVRSLVPDLPYPYVWLGGSDAIVEGEWRWVTGPEGEESGIGRQFWSGDYSGSPVDGAYTDWQLGEPNNSGDASGPGEDYLQVITGTPSWNDNTGDAEFATGFIVEFDTVPEPGCFALLGLGLAAVSIRNSRRAGR